MKIKALTLLLCLAVCAAKAGSKAHAHLNDAASTMYNAPKVPEFDTANQLALQAQKELTASNKIKADSLINLSIKTYPTLEAMKYALQVGRLPDIVGANLIIQKVIDRTQAFEGEGEVVYVKLYYNTIEKPLMMTKNRAVFQWLVAAQDYNYSFGDRAAYINALQAIAMYKLEPFKAWSQNDPDVNVQRSLVGKAALYAGDYQKAVSMFPLDNINMRDYRLLEHIEIYQQANDYASALKSANEIGNKLIKAQQLYQVYAFWGEPDKAMEHYGKVDNYIKKQNLNFYYLALVDLHKKNFASAKQNIENCLRLRDIGRVMRSVDKWMVYKAYGDAFAGLNQFDKAKDQYNIALLYYPAYQPAINALAKLESGHEQIIAADKTPPEINITEPTPARGLKVITAGNNVMVKGLATDPSGIKEVTINGLKVYSQNSGAFWGDVAMSTGINKITVTATDMAGNKAQKTFEIEKQATPQVATNDIKPVVPVEEKEGKNYCLLVAAQNYTDGSIPSLENPIADAVKLKLVLKSQYNFTESNIITLYNPKTADLKRQLLELGNTIQPEDNLLIFYAGHGIWVDKEKKGYWLMTDAQYKDRNTWLPNKDVLDLIATLPARHTLLITDACFSGSVFKTRGLKADAPAAIKEMDSKISRVAITSGNDTEVPDQSVFMKYLVKALSENKEKYLTAQKMFINHIIEAVMAESKTEPRYGTLELAGHVGGDFIFSKN
jgi:hypothetical protein